MRNAGSLVDWLRLLPHSKNASVTARFVELILEFEQAFCRWLALEADEVQVAAVKQRLLCALSKTRGRRLGVVFRRWMVALPLAHVFTWEAERRGDRVTDIRYIHFRLAVVLTMTKRSSPYSALVCKSDIETDICEILGNPNQSYVTLYLRQLAEQLRADDDRKLRGDARWARNGTGAASHGSLWP